MKDRMNETSTDPESKRVLEEIGDEATISMHLDAVPARVGDHHGGDASDDGVIVGRHVDAEQSMQVDDGVVLVDSFVRSTITNVVLRTGCHVLPAPPVVHPPLDQCPNKEYMNLPSGEKGDSFAGIRRNSSLQAVNYLRHLFDHFGVFAVTLVAASPSRISTDLHSVKLVLCRNTSLLGQRYSFLTATQGAKT